MISASGEVLAFHRGRRQPTLIVIRHRQSRCRCQVLKEHALAMSSFDRFFQ
jgi:hypothetical protein